MLTLQGIVPVIPIPFLQDETIDEESFRRTVDFVASQDLAGLCLPAYGSEFYKLTIEERHWAVATAIEVTAGRIPVIAQANHGSSRIAAEFARQYEALGADIISFALPRQFVVGDQELLRYAGRIADAVSVPILVQDFNPGGTTIGPQFIKALHDQHPNFRYAKLEEPLIVDKLVAIRDAVGNGVGIFEGWGGYYMLEAIAIDNCCGVMPGVPLVELFDRVFRFQRGGALHSAYELLGSLLPFVNFTLQNFEMFLQVEKRLLVRRGIIAECICREPTYTPSADVLSHIEFLLEEMVAIGERELGDRFVRSGATPSPRKETPGSVPRRDNVRV
jgi:dihydrodipicolinate synthase/N-acetylneuraminate lyase